MQVQTNDEKKEVKDDVYLSFNQKLGLSMFYLSITYLNYTILYSFNHYLFLDLLATLIFQMLNIIPAILFLASTEFGLMLQYKFQGYRWTLVICLAHVLSLCMILFIFC